MDNIGDHGAHIARSVFNDLFLWSLCVHGDFNQQQYTKMEI